MSRYAILLTFVIVTVSIVVVIIYILAIRETKDIYTSKSDITPVNSNKSGWYQSKYQQIHTESDGRANIFNELGECKMWGSQNKIFNGSDTEIGDFPCMALLEYQTNFDTYSFDCAGSLINHRYVLTAAHCLSPNVNLVNVRLGEYDTSKNPDCDDAGECQPEPLNVGIQKIIQHEHYSSGDFVNDIGLIRLSMDVPFTIYFILPICIPQYTMSSPTGNHVQVVGWGNTGINKQSAILQSIFIKIFDWEKCGQKFHPLRIYPSQLCAGGQHGKDACTRDSGGPLVVIFNKRTYIEGIVSYGEGCGKDGVPGVYTRVGFYHDWISNNLEP